MAGVSLVEVEGVAGLELHPEGHLERLDPTLRAGGRRPAIREVLLVHPLEQVELPALGVLAERRGWRRGR